NVSVVRLVNDSCWTDRCGATTDGSRHYLANDSRCRYRSAGVCSISWIPVVQWSQLYRKVDHATLQEPSHSPCANRAGFFALRSQYAANIGTQQGTINAYSII